jgi:hypothetical protein
MTICMAARERSHPSTGHNTGGKIHLSVISADGKLKSHSSRPMVVLACWSCSMSRDGHVPAPVTPTAVPPPPPHLRRPLHDIHLLSDGAGLPTDDTHLPHSPITPMTQFGSVVRWLLHKITGGFASTPSKSDRRLPRPGQPRPTSLSSPV